MKYRELHIQTQREFPNNAQTQGFGWLVRAGYLTREGELLPLGNQAVERLKKLSKSIDFFPNLSIPFVDNVEETFFLHPNGAEDVIFCPSESCTYISPRESARIRKIPFSQEEPLPVEKVPTPDCPSIEALANFLNIPSEKTAKALMFTRISDKQFVFVVIRGDMVMSEAKLRKVVGELRLAAPEEIAKAGAAAGYASPIGLDTKHALIVVDDLIPQSPNLVAGANESGYHLLNTNCGRDYTPQITIDLVLADEGNPCFTCGKELALQHADILAVKGEFHFDKILLALAETHHDDKGLTFPKPAAPFDVYLMHVPGKTINTLEKAEEVYHTLQNSGISVLFDDRDERAGVRFNDADLIGCPVRVTVGEKALQHGMVELKPRKEKEIILVPIEKIIEEIKDR